ncbi:hypothetical protein [Streptomyces sp. NBC_00582]|uniref:hypothetical protein n=1 Tax=Streptomyces sp. NBC_00582 TaxID=2975783 RepID=UPI002E8048FF|nr:hypothetical protein [Streptomyces sp. NBC_00582]
MSFDGDRCGDPATPTLDDWWLKADGRDLHDWLISREPGLIVNERVKRGLGLGDVECCASRRSATRYAASTR